MSSSSTGKKTPQRQAPPGRERLVRKYAVSALAAAHLAILLTARRADGWADWAFQWGASAFCVLLVLAIRDFVSPRKRDRLPDIPSMVAWGAAGLLEFHAVYPALAASRLVPAVLFPAAAFLLPAFPAAAYSAAAMAWILFSPSGTPPHDLVAASTVLLGSLGFAAGSLVRRKLGGPPPEKGNGRESNREEGTPFLPWNSPSTEDAQLPSKSLEYLGVLRKREELADCVRRILEGILPVTGADAACFVLPSSGPGDPFKVVAKALRAGAPFSGDVAIPGDFVPALEATLLRRTFLSGAEEAGTWPLLPDTRKTERPAGVAAAPVSVEGNVEGAILAFRYGEAGWAEPVGQALEMAAYLVGREIGRGKEQHLLNRYVAKNEGFHGLVRRIASISEDAAQGGEGKQATARDEVYRAVVEQAKKQLDVERVVLIAADAGGKRGRIAWESSGKPSARREGWTSIEGTYVEWVLRKGVHRIFSEGHGNEGKFPVLPVEWSGEKRVAHLLIPVIDAGEFRGVLVFEGGDGRSFDGQDAEVARDMLAILRMGISHALRMETLEKEASNDGLTGLLNKKTFLGQLASVLSRLDGRYACAVIMLDIDHFKKVNDSHGHPAGDEVLKTVASVIRKTIRKVDMAGRYGGEEFAIYLYETDQDHACQVAERLRLRIAKTRFVFAGKEIGVTASMGIACSPAHGRTCDELIGKADLALYASKQGGRDRVTVSLKQ